MATRPAACTLSKTAGGEIDVGTSRDAAVSASAYRGTYSVRESGGDGGVTIRENRSHLEGESASLSQGPRPRGCRGKESRRRCRREWLRRHRARLREGLGEDSHEDSQGAKEGLTLSTKVGEDGESAPKLGTAGAARILNSRGVGRHESDAHLTGTVEAASSKGREKTNSVALGPGTGAAAGWSRSAMAAAVVSDHESNRGGGGAAAHRAEFAGVTGTHLGAVGAEAALCGEHPGADTTHELDELKALCCHYEERATHWRAKFEAALSDLDEGHGESAIDGDGNNLQAGLADEQGQTAAAGAAKAHFAESWDDTARCWGQWCRGHRALGAWCVVAVVLGFYLLWILLFAGVRSVLVGDAEAMGYFCSWLAGHWVLATWFAVAVCTGAGPWDVCATSVVILAFGWCCSKLAGWVQLSTWSPLFGKWPSCSMWTPVQLGPVGSHGVGAPLPWGVFPPVAPVSPESGLARHPAHLCAHWLAVDKCVSQCATVSSTP